jgi:hypothetical protein
VTGDEAGVEGSRRRPDQQVGLDPAAGEGLEHADLDGPEAPAT